MFPSDTAGVMLLKCSGYKPEEGSVFMTVIYQGKHTSVHISGVLPAWVACRRNAPKMDVTKRAFSHRKDSERAIHLH